MSSSPEFRFMKVQVGSVETDPTQWDQFNTDELTAAEAVMRESHQNSLDAAVKGSPVRTRISVHDAQPKDSEFFRGLFEPLVPHLSACGSRFVPTDLGAPRFLVVEDFGTTGLTGSWNSTDTDNFSDFWRRFGNSHKSGSSGGSWGLGKLAYPATSIARTFFGVTIRPDDDQPLLMGQTVLQHHDLPSGRYVPFGFYSTLDAEGLQLPIRDKVFIERFSQAVGFQRTTEPGLSIAVPFVPGDLTEQTLIPALLRNYFYPILFDRLEIEIGGIVIKRETFGDVVKTHGGDEFADGSLEAFIRSLHQTLKEDKPAAHLPENWIYGKVGDALDAKALAALRDMLNSGDMVHIRVPLKVKAVDGKPQVGSLDVAFRLPGEGQKPKGLFVRNAITINAEAKKYRDKMAFAALVAGEGVAAQVLRASENPAHTEWSPVAQKLAEHWDTEDAAKRIRQIKRLPGQLCDLLVQAVEQKDDNALIEFFSIPDNSKPRAKPKPPPFPPKPEPPEPTPEPYSVQRRPTGFVVKGQAGSEPPTLRVTAAYDVVRGNPFTAFSELDFDFRDGPKSIEVSCEGAQVDILAPNVLKITPEKDDFTVDVEGFDTKRDLRISVRRVAS